MEHSDISNISVESINFKWIVGVSLEGCSLILIFIGVCVCGMCILNWTELHTEVGGNLAPFLRVLETFFFV